MDHLRLLHAERGVRVLELDGTFSRWAATYDDSVSSSHPMWEGYDDLLDHLARASGVGPRMSALDIGTGTGNLALRLAERGADVTGVDPCAEMLDVARRKPCGARPVTFRQVAEPFAELPYKANAFYAVVSSYAFHHVPHEEQEASLREMLRVLVPGGALAIGDIMLPNEAAAAAAPAQFGWLDDEPYPRLDHLRACAENLGFALEEKRFGACTWAVWGRKGI